MKTFTTKDQKLTLSYSCEMEDTPINNALHSELVNYAHSLIKSTEGSLKAAYVIKDVEITGKKISFNSPVKVVKNSAVNLWYLNFGKEAVITIEPPVMSEL